MVDMRRATMALLLLVPLAPGCKEEELPCGRQRFERDVGIDDRGELCAMLEFGASTEERYAAGECLVAALDEGRRAWAVIGNLDDPRPTYEHVWYVREPGATPRVWEVTTALAGPYSDFGSQFIAMSGDNLELRSLEVCENTALVCVLPAGVGVDDDHPCRPDDCPCPE
jgi:hypothetical protein